MVKGKTAGIVGGKENLKNIKENSTTVQEVKKSMEDQKEISDPLSPRITKFFHTTLKEVDERSLPKRALLKEPSPLLQSDGVIDVSAQHTFNCSKSDSIPNSQLTSKQNEVEVTIQSDKPETAPAAATAGVKSKQGIRGKKGLKKSSSVADSPSQPRPKTTKKKRSTTEVKSHMVTDYFPVRRSERRPKKEIKEEEQKHLHEVILSGKEEGLKVVDFEGKGRGVVATKPFKRGDFVVEYAGDLIDIEEAKRRDAKYATDSKYGCYMYYFVFKNKKYCVDATAESGRLGRLLNHSSKSGNCTTKLIGVNDTPHLILVAAVDIECGEELTYDYGDRSRTSIEAHPWLKS
ncbi:N-lysine methyltransferase KMT5A-A [Lingula anatina]|uniref:[histone H4]-lysine(20) N-methyltransferase n=1 Tax=Lingula anatina TaxID=7574 RepID=A0A1S3JKT3_LINAN|nr:N-lysine methyltransferase KMT5A-A [Lingula anatina]|eukprot:XP_013410514.1 N-lysine methyltransferase KMT5A-A [Lingula anatina]